MFIRVRGLSSKIYVAFLLAAAIPVAISGLVGIHFSIKALRTETLNHLASEVAGRSDAMARFVEQLTSEVFYVASSSPLRELADATASPGAILPLELRRRLERDFSAFALAYPYIYQIRYLDARGREVVRVDRLDDRILLVPEEELQDKSDRYYFPDAMKLAPGRIYVSPLDLNIERGQVESPERPVIRFGTPVADSAGAKAGLLVLNLHAELFLAQVQQMADAYGGVAYLFDREGFYLARTARADGSSTPFEMRQVNTLASRITDRVAAAIVAGERGTVAVGDWIVAFAPISVRTLAEHQRAALREWAFAVEYPQSRFFAAVFNLYLLYGVLVMCLAVTAVAGYLLSRRLLHPLDLLHKETAEIAKGNFSRRLEIKGGDEIADLGRSFNTMAERLEASYRALSARKDFLEDQVAARTAALERERANLETIIRDTADAILALRADGTVELANPPAERYFGEKGRPLRGVHIRDIWPAWTALGFDAQGPGHRVQRVESTIGGRILSITVSALTAAPAGESGVVLVARDVTEERRLAEERRELDRQMFQREKMATMGELAMGLAHEIGNPLAGMKTVVQVLREEDAGPSMQKYLGRLENEVDRLSAFLRTFHGYAAPQESHPVACRLEDVLDDVLLWTRKEAKSKGIAIDHRSCDAGAPALWADPNQLKQVLLNMVINAVNAMEKGGTVVIGMCARPDDDAVSPGAPRRVRFCVSDNGPGIAPEVLPRIFEPFFTTRENGSGLGLAVVKKIAVQHGADIIVHSELGSGTRFELVWPAAAESPAGPVAREQADRRTVADHG